MPFRPAVFSAVFLLIFTALFPGTAFTFAQQEIITDFSWRTWTQRDGLPSNEITSLEQSGDGYLYVGTPAGLVRFDGKHFVPVLPHESALPSLKDDPVSIATSPAGDGLLVALRSDGVIHISDKGVIPCRLPAALAQTPIYTVFRENERAFWVGFEGGLALRVEGDQHRIFDRRDGLSPNDAVQFAHDGEGRVWLACGTFLARHENGALIRVPVGSGNPRLRIASSRSEGPWIVANERVNKFMGGTVVDLDAVNTTTGAHFLQAMLEDSSGALWLGTRSRGLRRWTPDGSVRRLIPVPEDISALLEDAHGNIWAGTNGSGLIRVSPAVLSSFNRSHGLLENHTLAVCESSDGRVWFANRDGGVATLDDRKRADVVPWPRAWENFSALSVVPARDGRVWASSPYGLHLIDGTGIQQTITDSRLNGDNAPHVLFAARNGDIWFALLQEPGIGRIRDDRVELFGPEAGLGHSRVLTLAEDPQGRLWTGAEDGSLHRLEGGIFAPVSLQPLTAAGAIQAIHFDRAGTAWIGTDRSGILRLDTQGVRRISRQDGLRASNITQIVSDDAGALWLGSPTGISRIDFREIDDLLAGRIERLVPSAVGLDQGLPEATCLSAHQPAVWKTSSGILLFTTRQGVVAIDPEKDRDTRTSLHTQIRSLACNQETFKASPGLRIPPRPRLVAIRYSPLSLATPERVHVRYRLAGFDDTWLEADRGGVAEYPRLPPGRYTFEVRAHIAGIAASESSDTLTFTVAAAWWQTVWFRTATISLVILAIAAAASRWSHRRLQNKLARLERDSALDRERARIAKNIHDDLGAGLTRISLLTQSARTNEGEAQLDRIYRTVSNLTQSMDEIVWAVNPKNDDLESVANYIVEFAQSYLSDANLRCRVLVAETLPPRVVTAQFRHHLFLTCKEVLNNIVKHARAADVAIEIDVRGDELILTITDDGVGLLNTAEIPSRRNGLKNMRSRMESIGGRFDIFPAQPRGTTVSLTARLSPSASAP